MEKFIKNKKLIISLIFLGIFSIGQMVLASTLNVDWPTSPLGTSLTEDSDISQFIAYLYEWGIFLGGLLAFIALIIAGFLYLTSVGNPTKMQEAKDRVVWALGGLTLLLGSWLILNTINPQLTKLQLPSFNPEEEINIDEEIVFDLQKLMEQGYKSCTKVEIVRENDPTITLTSTTKCTPLTPEILTDEEFGVKGYTDGEATSCAGFIVFYGENSCHTSIGSVSLAADPGQTESVKISKDSQSVEFFSGEK